MRPRAISVYDVIKIARPLHRCRVRVENKSYYYIFVHVRWRMKKSRYYAVQKNAPGNDFYCLNFRPNSRYQDIRDYFQVFFFFFLRSEHYLSSLPSPLHPPIIKILDTPFHTPARLKLYHRYFWILEKKNSILNYVFHHIG